MRSIQLIFIASCAASAVPTNSSQLKAPLPRPVEQSFGLLGRTERVRKLPPAAKTLEYQKVRATDNCVFPIDLVIVQDATASFEDDYEEMRTRQLKLVVDGITAAHPGSRIGISSFKDKPVWSLGDATDYCYYENLPLQPANFTALYNTYSELESYGGADPAENQLGAIIATAQSKTMGWGANPLAANLIVVATDAWFHYDSDGLNAYGMTPFTGAIDFADLAGQCTSQYYPSPLQTMAALDSIGAYAGFLLFDSDWAAGRPYSSWKWFNAYIGQQSNFLTNATENSADFWANLAKIIAVVENDECQGSSTMAPTTLPVTTVTPATSTAGQITTIPGTTLAPTTVSVASTAGQITTIPGTTLAPTTVSVASSTSIMPTDCPEPCPSGDCPCPEVVIKLRQRPEQLHFDVKNSS